MPSNKEKGRGYIFQYILSVPMTITIQYDSVCIITWETIMKNVESDPR